MKKISVILLLLLTASYTWAENVTISLLEKKTEEITTYYSFDTKSSELSDLEKTTVTVGLELPRIYTYSVKNRKLVSLDKELTNAVWVLFQCQFDGFDLVIIRDEYNSFSSPLKILSALAGHPIQVSKIILVQLKDGEVVAKKELSRKPSSYYWEARILK